MSMRQQLQLVNKNDVAMQQVLLEQMEDCFSFIKKYLGQVLRVKELENDAKEEGAIKMREMLNFAAGQSVNLLQISLNDCYRNDRKPYIKMAKAKLALFNNELNTFMESVRNQDDLEEVQKRAMPILNNLIRIVNNDEVPLNPGPKLTSRTFTDETVGNGFGYILAAGHQIQDRITEVNKDPNQFYKNQEKLISSTKKEVAQLFSTPTQCLDVEAMVQDIDQRRVDYGILEKRQQERNFPVDFQQESDYKQTPNSGPDFENAFMQDPTQHRKGGADGNRSASVNFYNTNSCSQDRHENKTEKQHHSKQETSSTSKRKKKNKGPYGNTWA